MSAAPVTELPWYLPKQPARTTTKQITVIGAGIAGCTAAVALKRRGFEVTIVDRHPQAGSEASETLRELSIPNYRHEMMLYRG